MNYKKLTFILLCICTLTGCRAPLAFWESSQTAEEVKQLGTLGESEQINYDIPVSTPWILVNQVGYQPESRKIAIFRGKELNSTFRIVNAESNKVVYIGNLEEKGLNEETGEYISYGIFTSLKTEGTYYVETAKIGRSYHFEVRKDIYSSIFTEAYEKIISLSEFSLEESCYVLATLIASYELYPGVYNATTLIEESGQEMPDILIQLKELTDRLLEIQDEKTGIFAGREELTAQAAGVLADFSNLYKDYDTLYASRCLKAAERSWAYIEKNKEKLNTGDIYFAASELYRLTGSNKYHIVIKEYWDETIEDTNKTDFNLYGDLAYLFTKKSVDMDICHKIMTVRMAEVEDIAEASHEHTYMVCQKEAKEQNGMLQKMVKLATIDYVISNHEYATVMEDHLHFLLGRNPEVISYVADMGDAITQDKNSDVLSDSKKAADFIFMITAIISHEADGKQ